MKAGASRKDSNTGAARLSKARHVNGTVKSRNERNPCRLLQVSDETAEATRRKVRMTSNQRGLYALGYTHATMVGTEGCQPARGSQSQKADLSSDCRLQLAYMKPESLVIADQNAAVNTFPGLVHTARHTTRVCNTRSRWSNHLELALSLIHI